MNSQLITIITTLMMNTNNYKANMLIISERQPWQIETNIPYEDKEKVPTYTNNKYAIKEEELKIRFEKPKKLNPDFSFKEKYSSLLKGSYLTRTQHK